MPTTTPTKTLNTFYKDMRDFTAWHPYGTHPGHNRLNHDYIPIPGFTKRLNMPKIMQDLVDHPWTSSVTPTGPRPAGGPVIGRGAAPNAGGAMVGRALPPGHAAAPAPIPFRQAFGGSHFKSNWDHVNLFDIVGAYTFRGDRRSPEMIKGSGGFQPPITRTDTYYTEVMAKTFVDFLQKRDGQTLDAGTKTALIAEVKRYIETSIPIKDRRILTQYRFWHAVMSQQQYHLQAMTDDSFMRGYISTTRDTSVAAVGASGGLAAAGMDKSLKGAGFIYVTRVEAGFLIKKNVGGISKEEGEIAHLGTLAWSDVYGFMDVMNQDVIYLRNGFDQSEWETFKLVLASMSNTRDSGG